MKNLIRRTIAAILIFGVMAFVTACGPGGGGGLIGNQDPVAIASHIDGATKYDFEFDGSHSTDSDGDIVAWEWTFGDGGFDAGEIVEYSYGNTGAFTVTLTVTDDEGARDSAIILVTIDQSAPVASFIASPSTVNSIDVAGIKDPAMPGFVSFDGRASKDADSTNSSGDNDIDIAVWDFGDGSEPITGIWTSSADDEHGISETFSVMREVTHTYTELPVRTYNPVTGEPQTLHYTVTLTITDYTDRSSTTTRDVVFRDVLINGRPQAFDDSVVTNEDVQVDGDVSTNDIASPDGGNVWSLVDPNGGAVHGTVIMGNNGSYTYSPDPNYHGNDTFNYSLRDVGGDWSASSVAVTILSVNDAPIAVNDAYSVDEGSVLTVGSPGVLVNDTDIDGNVLTAAVNTDPTNGDLTLNSNGLLVYDPDTDWSGVDSFTYYVNDGLVDSNIATVTITVNSVNDAPVSIVDSYDVDEDALLSISAPGVLGNDSDVNGDPIFAVLNTATTNGTLDFEADGSFTYTPGLNYNGPDSFTYHSSDGSLESGIVTVNITVNPVNDNPVAAFTWGATPKKPDPKPDNRDISFNGSGSSDIDGSIVSWYWEYGDGETGSTVTGLVDHQYPNTVASYNVTLTVTDNNGGTSSVSHTVDVS